MSFDPCKLECAEWLEHTIEEMLKEKPTKIALSMRCSDGNVETCYYNCNMEDRMTLGQYLVADGLMGMVYQNASRIVHKAQEQEEKEGDDQWDA